VFVGAANPNSLGHWNVLNQPQQFFRGTPSGRKLLDQYEAVGKIEKSPPG